MDLRKALLLCTALQLMLLTLVNFHEKWEHDHSRRQRDEMLFLHFLRVRRVAFVKSQMRKKRKSVKRKCWVKPRSQDWWNSLYDNFTDKDWIENFRMSKATFHLICERLKPYLSASDNCVRPPTSVDKKVAIALYKLASCAEYRVIANQFGTSKSMVCKYVHDVCDALYSEFSKEFLMLPNEYEAEGISKAFEDVCGIPNIIGAIDGTHIPILPPSNGYRDFINRKGWPSYNMMAVVDNLYRFRYVTCKHPGSVHDAAVLKDSSLYKSAEIYIPKSEKKIDGVNIPYFLLEDPAYPLLPWLLKGYKGNISEEEDSFNVYLSRGRVVVENAFGRLKARFRCLLKRIDIHYSFVPNVVAACVILHNIIESRKDTFVRNWLEAVSQAEIEFPQPKRQAPRQLDSYNMSVVRSKLTMYMTKFPIRRSRPM